jgi:hypothetical protein
MKVYTRVVIDMDTLETLEEESFEYRGPVAECKSGGAGGGTGGASYPDHMVKVHTDWLNKDGTKKVSNSVVDLMNTAMSGDSPFTNFSTVNVDDVFLGKNVTVTSFVSPYSRLSDLGCFNIEGKYAEYLTDDDADIAAAITAESNLIDDEIYQKQLPAFQAGLDDINAVQSSSFILGEALIWDGKNKAMARVSSALRIERLNSRAEISLKRIGAYIEWSRLVTASSIEIARIYTAARHDVDGLTVEIGARDKLFDLTIYQYGVNVMSSITGSAIANADPGPGKSGLGGPLSAALSGASVGAMIPGATPATAGIGAAIGLAGYYLS